MQSELFPCQYENPRNSKIKNYNNFDQYFKDSFGFTKHGLLLNLVEENIDDEDVIDGFTSLQELCWTARYTTYKYSTEIADECYKNLEIIEVYCDAVDI